MSEEPPIIEGAPLSDDQKRLLALFGKIEEGQLELLDAAGKRVIELASILVGVIFGATALHETFPPAFLENGAVKLFAAAALIFYLAAIAAGMGVVQPRLYRVHRHNLTRMRDDLDRILRHKSFALSIAGVLFWIASLFLALMVLVIILLPYGA